MKFVDKLRTQKLLSFTLILFTLSLGIVIGTLINNPSVRAERDNNAAPGATPLVIPNPVDLSNTFSQIAKQVEGSVVNISTTYNAKARQQSSSRGTGSRRQRPTNPDDQGDGNGGGGNGSDGFDFFRFFGNPFGGEGGAMPRQNATGSGVVVDRAGYILTNNHVVEKADRIQVKFMDDPKEYDAKLVGADEATDLAVIRVEPGHNLAAVKIGNSDAVNVGDWCMAIGSPFGFQATVTAGIISAKERDIPGDTTQYQHFLQTDAAINPGNSGGALLNIRGELIGINTAIASRSGSYEGIGFAMPVNTAVGVYNAIIKDGKVVRGSIGITFASDAANAHALLKANGLDQGVFVDSVKPGGPSDKGGLKEGDIIVAVNGKPVRDGNALVNVVSNTPVGSTVALTVVREGKRGDYRVTIGDITQVFAENFRPAESNGTPKSEGTSVSFGMYVQALTEARRQNLGIKEPNGLEITEVEPNSFAEDVLLHVGDILLSLNNKPLGTIQDLKDIQSRLKPGDAVAFKVMTRGRDQFGRPAGNWTTTYLAGELPMNPR
jgi:serine protease Do